MGFARSVGTDGPALSETAMGLFNRVAYDYDCEKCGESLDDFQTKDGVHDYYSPAPYAIKDAPWCFSFYGFCRKCSAWYEFEIRRRDPEVVQTKVEFV